MQIKEWIEKNKENIIRDVCSLVEIPSVSRPGEGGWPFGAACGQVLKKALSLAEENGLETENHENYCGSAVLKGESSEELGLFSHLDVVPEGTGWTKTEPYTPLIMDGWIYGRGSADNKGPAVAALYAMKYFKENQIPLHHTLRQFYGCDEERGMEDIAYYLKYHKPPVFSLVPDAAFPVCCGEKGRYQIICEAMLSDQIISIKGGEGINSVPSHAEIIIKGNIEIPTEPQTESQTKEQPEVQQGIQPVKGSTHTGITVAVSGSNTRITASGLSSHAAKPEAGDNAVTKLAGYLVQNRLLQDQDDRIFRFLADGIADYYGTGLNINCEDEDSGPLTVVGSMAEITEDGSAIRLSMDLRYPVTADTAKIESGLKNAAESCGWKVKKMEHNPSFHMDKESDTVKLLTQICSQVYDRQFEPYCMGGGTYARKLPKAVGYGPGLSYQKKPCEEGHGKGHQPDECMCIENLVKAIEIYIKAILELDKMRFI